MVKIKSTPKKRRVGVGRMMLNMARRRQMHPAVAYVKKYMPYVKFKANYRGLVAAGKRSKFVNNRKKLGIYRMYKYPGIQFWKRSG